MTSVISVVREVAVEFSINMAEYNEQEKQRKEEEWKNLSKQQQAQKIKDINEFLKQYPWDDYPGYRD